MKYKRRLILTALVFAFSLQVPVSASTAQTAFIVIQPLWVNVKTAIAELEYSGTTANCEATILGLSGTTSITATMYLEQVVGNSVSAVSTWSKTVNGSNLYMSETAAVQSNGSYRLRVNATVVRNGVSENISFTD